MEVIKCGTEVVTKIEGVHAIITCASIRFDKIQYEISYFRGGVYYSAWVSEGEFNEVSEVEKTNIGFKKN
jgi:hypothetical protein